MYALSALASMGRYEGEAGGINSNFSGCDRQNITFLICFLIE